MAQKVSLLLPWGEGKCTIPTFQQALLPLLLSHGGGICPQSHSPDREAGSMHTFQITEDTGLCADMDSGAVQMSRNGNWRQEDTWEGPLAQLALQSSEVYDRASTHLADGFRMLETPFQLCTCAG